MLDSATTIASLPSSDLPSPDSRGLVLVLHGFLATAREVGILATRLRRSGYRTDCVDLCGLFGRFHTRTVEEQARILAERVEELSGGPRRGRIDLVGHSQGGLVGRYFVQKLNGADHVRHLVTLGTPHRGTPWACAGHLVGPLLPSLHQMTPGSRLLRELKDECFPERVQLTSIYSQCDRICPPSSCRLDAGGRKHLKNVELPRGGHLIFLSSRTIAAVIRRELGPSEPVAFKEPTLAARAA